MRFWGGEVQDSSAGMAVFNEGFEGLEGLEGVEGVEGCWGKGWEEGRKGARPPHYTAIWGPGLKFVCSFQVPHQLTVNSSLGLCLIGGGVDFNVRCVFLFFYGVCLYADTLISDQWWWWISSFRCPACSALRGLVHGRYTHQIHQIH